MNFTDILEKLSGGTASAGGRLAAGSVSTVIILVARLALCCAAFALALLLDVIPELWVTVILVACSLAAGYDIAAGAVLGILRGDYLNRELLVSLAVILAFAFGAKIEACALVLLYQISGIFIDYAVERTRRTVLDSVYCDTSYASRIDESGQEGTVRAGSLQPGDRIVIRAGETVPCDCIILDGSSAVDRAPLGDDSGAAPVKEGDELLSGCVNLSGELHCEVSSAQADSAAARLYASVQAVPGRGQAVPSLLAEVKKYFPAVVTVLAVLVAGLLPLVMDISYAESVRRATMFLVIASPVSMLAAVPVIRLCAACGAARAGVLFDSCSAMDAAASAATAAFDESGTLTEGRPRVVSVSAGRMGQDVLLKIAAHALSYSSSPVSRSVIEAYGGTIYIDLIENFNEVPGYGVEVHVDGIPIRVGTRELMRIGRVDIPAEDLYYEDGETCVYVAISNEYAGCIVLSDPVRAGAAEGIDDIRHSGVENIVMFSADSRDRAARLASSMGITEYYSECSREKLRGSLSQLRQGCAPGRTLMFVGAEEDFGGGHTAADVDVAMSGTDTLSMPRSCDITVLGGKVGRIAEAIGIARYARMLCLVTAAGAALVKLILLIIAAFGISTLWFTVFIDAIAAVAAALVSILAFSGELYS